MVCIACVACSESSESIDTIAGKAVFRLETAAPDARTELTTAEDGRYKAIWKAGDSYAVVQVADESVALSTGTVDEDAPSISAIAMFDQVAASSYRYIFASPTVVASADGSSVELSMADSQAPATMDTFDGSTDLILSDVVERTSQPNGVSVPFNAQRISAIGKMTIKNLPLAEGETATSVTFATTKPIAGKLSIMVSDIAAGTPLQNSAVSEPSAAVTVTLPQAQSGDFTAYFSCLPTILSAGEEYSVTVNTTNSSYTKQGQVPSDMSFTSGRMTSFAVNMSGTGSMIPSDLNRVIFYTSTDGNVVTPYKTDAFGANIVSNTYENGQGVITFDGEVTTIGANAFWTRVTLASITLPQSVNSIGYYAFQGCNSLRSITIPDSVTNIDTNPFLDCKALEEFNGKFASEDKRSLVVGGSLVSFAIGSGVTEYNIPSDVNIVSSSSFAGCTTLTAVTIPSSTTVIRAAAFSNCSNLASVYCQPITPPTGGSNMFNNNAANRKIYVPAASVDAYKSAQHWSDYADAIVAEDGDATIGGFEMVFVEGGTFTMGATAEQKSDAYDDESPTHSVTLSSYYIGRYEVTQAQWYAVMGSNPSYFKGDNLPVEQVTWNDVQEFITKLNQQTGKTFRLPTEAEWEYAARGGNQSKGYKYSGSNSISDVAWCVDNSNRTTHAVGEKQPNELGIYDMSGNVWEWCQDWYGSYSSDSQINPIGPSSGSYCVYRGGSWEGYANYCRVSERGSFSSGSRGDYLGFRLVCVSK